MILLVELAFSGRVCGRELPMFPGCDPETAPGDIRSLRLPQELFDSDFHLNTWVLCSINSGSNSEGPPVRTPEHWLGIPAPSPSRQVRVDWGATAFQRQHRIRSFAVRCIKFNPWYRGDVAPPEKKEKKDERASAASTLVRLPFARKMSWRPQLT